MPLKVFPSNMKPMSVTEETFQVEMLPLKRAAWENMACMLRTTETSHRSDPG